MGMRLVLLAAVAIATQLSCSAQCMVDCAPPGFIRDVKPPMDAAGVPTNARIWIGSGFLESAGPEASAATITDASGTAVTARRQKLSGGPIAYDVFLPDAPLSPRTTYTVQVGDQLVTRFTTGDGPDTAAPPVPTSTLVGEVERHECGDTYGFDLALKSEGATFFVTNRSRESGRFDETFPSGVVSVLSNDGKVYVGTGLCVTTWPEAAPGESVSLRHRAIDLAGNVSEWSPVETRALGCRSAGGAGLFALVGLLGRRRARV